MFLVKIATDNLDDELDDPDLREARSVQSKKRTLLGALSVAIDCFRPPRTDELLADLVIDASEYGRVLDAGEMWPEHGTRVREFVAAARALKEGWEENDRERDEYIKTRLK